MMNTDQILEGFRLNGNKSRIRIGRIIYLILAILFTLCIFTQIYLAGMAIFMNPAVWLKHMMFVHLFGFNVPIFMLIFAFIGALPRWAYWQLFGIFTSIFLMYFSANMRTNFPWIGPLHVIIAILLLGLSCLVVGKTWTLIFRKK